MLTLEKSKELFLLQLKSRLHLCINNRKEARLCVKNCCKASRKLMQIHALIYALPASNHIFKWYRKNLDKVCIELMDDNVYIYKTESQYLERVEFGEGDLCNLIYKTLENQN